MNKKVIILSVFILAVGLALGLGLKKIFFKPQEVVKRVVPKAKVAIVIDDWGYNLRCLDLLKQMEVPLTVSILPNLPYSSRIAMTAKSQGQEIVLHLPLEPQTRDTDAPALEENTITTTMPKGEVIAIFARACSSVPGASGVSNHMGSQATKDSRLMSIIFTELAKSGLYFLDNLVTNKSICAPLAQKMKVRFAVRNFFLDNLDDREYIQAQLEKLSTFALSGSHTAIGVGHARLLTLQILQEQIPFMQARGIKFVFVSELVK